MISIVLNDVNINTGNTTVRTVQHDSMPKITVNSLQPTREDGEKLINVKLRSKIITIEGTVKGSTRSSFESTLDTLKRDFNVDRKNLDIEYAGATRRYNVSLRSFTMSRNFFNVTFATYSATFLVETGYGTGGDVIQSATGDALDDTLTTMAVTFEGTHIPYPTARFTIDTVGNLETIQYKSVSTGKQLEVTTAWSDGDVILIDSEDSTFLRNGSFIDFSGQFPQFKRGEDTIQLTMTTTAGGIDQSNETSEGGAAMADSPRFAQSFKPSASTDYSKVELFIASDPEEGDPSSESVIVSIQGDNGGEPDGVDIVGSSVIVNGSNMPEFVGGWITFNFSLPVALISGTTYWIVIGATGTSAIFIILLSRSNNYTDGTFKGFVGGTWNELTDNDALFKVYKSETPTYSIDFKQTYIKKYL